MAFNFPANPADGDAYSLNGITYVYRASTSAWEVATNINTTELDADLATKKEAAALAIALGG